MSARFWCRLGGADEVHQRSIWRRALHSPKEKFLGMKHETYDFQLTAESPRSLISVEASEAEDDELGADGDHDRRTVAATLSKLLLRKY